MSQHSAAAIEIFAGLLEFAGETVTVDGTEYTGQVSELSRDEIFSDGGTEDAGGFRIKLKLSDFPDDPAEYTDVIARDRTCQVVDPVTRNNGHLEIICKRVDSPQESETAGVIIGDEETGEAFGDETENILVGDPNA